MNRTNKNVTKLLSVFLLLGCVCVSTAQKLTQPLFDTVSQDSLLYMVYANTLKSNNTELQHSMEEMFPDRIQQLMNYSNEFCLSIHRNDFYDTYTVTLNDVKQGALMQLDSILQQMDLTLGDLNTDFITLQRQGINAGFIRIDGNQYTIKLYAIFRPVNPELRIQFDAIKPISNSYSEYNYSLFEKRDSIMKQDSVTAVQFVNGKIMQEKWTPSATNVKNAMDWQSILGDRVEHSSVLAYINPDAIQELPYHYYMLSNETIYDNNKWSSITQGLFCIYKEVWFGVELQNDGVKVTSMVEGSTKHPINKKLDKELLTYLPNAHPGLLITYNMDLSVLKYHLAKFLYAGNYDKEENGYIKLVALAFDDELLNALGNGFITVIDGDINGHHLPAIKVALRMPNQEKGELLLDILQKDFKLLTKVEEDCYQFINRELRGEREVFLYIHDDIWVLGTDNLEAIKSTLTKKQLQELYPQLNESSLSQYAEIKEKQAKEINRHFSKVTMSTKIVDKHKVMTEIKMLN